jgi:hypothetical protein
VVLGAGFDTFAYRQPPCGGSLRIYEVDHPITQQWKRDRLRAADIAIPSNLTFVPIDFESASIPDALRAIDLSFGLPAPSSSSRANATELVPSRGIRFSPLLAIRSPANLRSAAIRISVLATGSVYGFTCFLVVVGSAICPLARRNL